MSTTWDEISAKHQPLEKTVKVPMRADLLDLIEQLEDQLRVAQRDDPMENRVPVAPGIADQIHEVEQELAASEVTFRFRAIGRSAYNELLAQNPPTAQQKADAEADGNVAIYNADTFVPQVLAASCIEPAGTTVENMRDVWENWSSGQCERLWRACIAVNMGSADVGPKSVIASAVRLGSKPSSDTADR